MRWKAFVKLLPRLGVANTVVVIMAICRGEHNNKNTRKQEHRNNIKAGQLVLGQ